MKTVLCLAVFLLLSCVALASHSGLRIGIPIPFIKLRFIDIADLGGHSTVHHGHGGGHGGGFGFGIGIGGGGGGGGHHGGW